MHVSNIPVVFANPVMGTAAEALQPFIDLIEPG
jgi:hypothetical protein